MKKWQAFLTSLLVVGGLLALVACSHEEGSQVVPATRQCVRHVAVVAPIGDDATKVRLERTAQWFLDNFKEAQQGSDSIVVLQLEWHDELSEDLTALSSTLAARSDVVAVIGPFSNEGLALFAPACKKTQKPLIAPTATSEEVIRRYAVPTTSGQQYTPVFLWPLCETDVRLTETMMEHYVTQKGKYADMARLICAVFSPDDKYGRTFYNWAPFHAGNMGIDLERNELYASTQELLSSMKTYLDEKDEYGFLANNFCVVENAQQLLDVARMRYEWWEDVISKPEVAELVYRTYFIFRSLSEEALAAFGGDGRKLLQGYQGFLPYADPATGFEKAYDERFGVTPTFAECKFYDALLLTGLAALRADYLSTEHSDKEDMQQVRNIFFNACIWMIAFEHEEEQSNVESVWTAQKMHDYIVALRSNDPPHGLCGAAGHIIFDIESGTQVALTTYVHWQIDNGKIRHLTYYGPEGKQVVAPSVAWEIFYDEETVLKDFAAMASEHDIEMNYPRLTDQYAVLVQGSHDFVNYRHQADVLSVYQLLRRGGFDDDHIILVLDGSLAQQTGGIIRAQSYDSDLLSGTEELPRAVVDYDNRDITAADIADILLGKASGRLPVVVPQDEGHNVLFYWSGHGRSISNGGVDEFEWRDAAAGQGFTAAMLHQTATQMKKRKLLLIAEPCYGEATAGALDGIPGALAITGASRDEQSWADNWNFEMMVWMSDRFTQNIVQRLTQNPAVTYRDLFIYCVQRTLGSHVRIINGSLFGNLYITSPQEFIQYKRQ